MRRSPLSAALPFAVALTLLPLRAHAVVGEENITLALLVAKAAEQVTQLRAALEVATQTYNETQRYVGMVEDARNAFTTFQRSSTALVVDPLSGVDNLFPDAHYLRSQLSTPANWARGTGALQDKVQQCINGQGPEQCASFYKELKAEQAKASIEATMGKSPAGRDDIALVDAESADAIAGAHNIANRDTGSQAALAKLQALCARGTSPESMASCQATAAIQQTKEMTTVNEQLAEANRLQAVGLAAQNAERKREVREAEARQQAVQDGFRDMTRTRLQVPAAEGVAP